MDYKNLYKIIAILMLFSPITLLQAQNSNMEIHQKYAGDVVFAKEKINFENIDDGILKENFKMLSTIYGKIILEKPLAEYYEENNWTYDYNDEKYKYNFSTVIYVDGEEKIKWLDELAMEAFNNYTTFDIVIAPRDPDKLKYSMESASWTDLISNLEEGKHTVKVEMRAENVSKPGIMKDALASGTFHIKVEKSKLDEFRNKFGIHLPKASIIAPEVEEGVLVATKNMYEAMTPVKAIIIEPTGQWQYSRDMQDNILSRNFVAAVVFKSFDGDCYIKTARYFQDHLGNYQFDDVRLSEKLEDYLNYRVPCENIK
ncbi:MAG: hypothetical protein U5Q03_05090 [Bacteroidota bacterium]|nr:hypothetical protein [Bacteroidota bacterium]